MPGSPLNPNAKTIANLKAAVYMKAYNMMGYDAFTPGELDLSLGIDDLIKMSHQADFPFLAANLLNPQSNEPIFKPYVIKEVQEVAGMKVGIFGLISGRFPAGTEKFKIADPMETAKKVVAVLKSQCRVIVALAHLEADEERMLAVQVHGIDFIVNGHRTRAQAAPQFVNHTQIFVAGARGEFLGQADLFRQRTKLYSRYQLIPLKLDYSEKEEIKTMVTEFKSHLQTALQPSMRTEPANSSSMNVAPLPSFVAGKECQTCHPREYAHWATTAHAQAYDTLIKKDKAFDPSCLACHTTRQGSPENTKSGLENVHCEACHGPMNGHPDSQKELEKVDEDDCRQCHNPTNSPNFNYDRYVQKILHPRMKVMSGKQ
ncbi:MAG: putative cytochrome protein [Deltaproteobacteria bacterium]|nr:putative cytochrome protein [Deltaproteobacteria bacterium]MBP1717140.1 putative cytochrome protein [Deltaproteobacteria bacterium]